MAAPKKPAINKGTTGKPLGRNNAGPNPYRQQINQGGPNRVYGSSGLPEGATVTNKKVPSIGPRTGKPAAGYAGTSTYSQSGSRMKSTPAGPVRYSKDAAGTKILPKASPKPKAPKKTK